MWYILFTVGLTITLYSGYKISQTPNSPIEAISQKELNKEKGNAFEDFVVKRVNNKVTTLVAKSSDYMKNGIYSEDNQTPDLKFKKKWSAKTYPFAIECKYRSQFNDKGAIVWSKEQQIENYNHFKHETDQPVFISIGIGGTPENPEQVYMVPLKILSKTFAYKSYIEKYEIDPTRPFFYNHEKQLFHNPVQ